MPQEQTVSSSNGKFAVVAAVTSEFGIGRSGDLPWSPKRLSLDMAFLKYVTLNKYVLSAWGVDFEEPEGRNVVIMGRKTWDSIPARFRPMENRVNIVITRDSAAFRNTSLDHQNLLVASSVPEALTSAANASPHGQIFILGGSSVYEEALKHPDCECVFLTRLKVHPDMPCDAFFPARELERYPICQKLTTHVFNILKSSLPKSSTIILNQPDQDVKEHEIRYEMVVYKK